MSLTMRSELDGYCWIVRNQQGFEPLRHFI